MPYQIDAGSCIACGACELECAQGAISEVNGAYTIDASKCQGCASCAVVCPVGSPLMV
jgi:MinD superfamily P-loop ATPase